MMQEIFDPAYWKRRLERARELHHAVFICPKDRWERIEEAHRKVLSEIVNRDTSILDAGCGYGRLLDLLPDSWNGTYCGLDISPDFIARAKKEHPGENFIVADVRDIHFPSQFDLAIAISFRPMVKRNDEEAWKKIEERLKALSKRQLYLEYDEENPIGT